MADINVTRSFGASCTNLETKTSKKSVFKSRSCTSSTTMCTTPSSPFAPDDIRRSKIPVVQNKMEHGVVGRFASNRTW